MAEKKPYVYQEFPKLMYHATQGPVAVKSREDQDALGSEWSEKHPNAIDTATGAPLTPAASAEPAAVGTEPASAKPAPQKGGK